MKDKWIQSTFRILMNILLILIILSLIKLQFIQIKLSNLIEIITFIIQSIIGLFLTIRFFNYRTHITKFEQDISFSAGVTILILTIITKILSSNYIKDLDLFIHNKQLLYMFKNSFNLFKSIF